MSDQNLNQDETYQVTISKQYLKSLELEDSLEGTLSQSEHSVTLEFGGVKKGMDIPMRYYLIPALLSAWFFFLMFIGASQVALTGELSIASVVIIVGALTGMGNFLYFYTKKVWVKNEKINHFMFWRNLPAIFISYLIILGVALLLVFKILGGLFYEVSFDLYTAGAFTAIMTMIINYVMIYIAQTLTPARMIRTLSFIIIGGVTLAMMTNKDQLWWVENFSFLGTPDASNSWQFNLTLILSALLMIALIDYLFEDIYKSFGKTLKIKCLKYLLVATAICLGGVGFFPYNDQPFYQAMHNRVAGYLVYLIIALIVMIRWLIPDVEKQFLRLSYVIGGILILSAALFYGIHYLSLTAFELVAFLLAFSWLLLLLNYLIQSTTHHQGNISVYLVRQSETEKES